MKTNQRLGLAALSTCILVGVVAGVWWSAFRSPSDRGRPPVYLDARRDALIELRNRLVPSTEGGWVAETPGEPSLDRWLLAASQAPGPSRSFDEALANAEQALARPGDHRSLSLVLAGVLPGPTADRALAGRLARSVLEQTESRLAAGDGAWLATLLQLSAGASEGAGDAGRLLSARAGSSSCDRLPAASAPLPAPATALTVAVRILVLQGAKCPGARQVLAAALLDPAWDTWVATAELADLAALAGDLPVPARLGLARRFDRFTEVRGDRPIDLGAIVQVQSARRRLDLASELSPELANHLEGQSSSRGGLPGRSGSVPTPFDVAVARQLVGEALVPRRVLLDTGAVRAWPDEIDGVDPVVGRLLAGDRPLRCGQVPDSAPAPARVSFAGLATAQIWELMAAWCRNDLDLAEMIGRIRASGDTDQAALRIAVAQLGACRLDRQLVRDLPGLDLVAKGPFADDSLIVWARSVAADPSAACAAAQPR